MEVILIGAIRVSMRARVCVKSVSIGVDQIQKDMWMAHHIHHHAWRWLWEFLQYQQMTENACRPPKRNYPSSANADPSPRSGGCMNMKQSYTLHCYCPTFAKSKGCDANIPILAANNQLQTWCITRSGTTCALKTMPPLDTEECLLFYLRSSRYFWGGKMHWPSESNAFDHDGFYCWEEALRYICHRHKRHHTNTLQAAWILLFYLWWWTAQECVMIDVRMQHSGNRSNVDYGKETIRMRCYRREYHCNQSALVFQTTNIRLNPVQCTVCITSSYRPAIAEYPLPTKLQYSRFEKLFHNHQLMDFPR